MHTFGFVRDDTIEKNKKRLVWRVHVFLVMLCIVLLRSVYRVWWWWQLRESPQDLFTIFPHTALLLHGRSADEGRILQDIYTLTDAVREKKYILPHDTDRVHRVLDYLANDEGWMKSHILDRLGYVGVLAQEFAQWDDDIISMLGYETPQTYLFILQNAAEKRPNGGFFGSFAVLTIDRGRIERFDILDSYVPGFDRPGASLQGPSWLLHFLPERDVYFVGANKIGFTYHDGAAIQQLYETSYPQQSVRGVIFLTTELFAYMLPWFREHQRERQFINASVNLIQENLRRGKKNMYLWSVASYMEENKIQLVRGMLDNLEEILERRYINVYFTDISGSMHTWLRERKLTTRFEDDAMYFRDSNISFSKIDAFVEKRVQFENEVGDIVLDSFSDIVDIWDLVPGAYNIVVTYALDIPQTYVQRMAELEKYYGIVLGDRERHILALNPTRATRWVVYMPEYVHIRALTGDHYHEAEFTTPFSRNMYYKAKSQINHTSTQVIISVDIWEYWQK